MNSRKIQKVMMTLYFVNQTVVKGIYFSITTIVTIFAPPPGLPPPLEILKILIYYLLINLIG